MKNLSQLKKAVSILKPKSTILPILECVLVMNNRLYITDLNTSIIFKDIGIGLDFVQDAKDFVRVCDFINDPIFSIKGKKLIVSGSDESFTYRCEETGDFPKIEVTDALEIGKLNSNDCSRINRAFSVVSKDELRPAMCAVALKDSYIIGTDGYSAIYEASDFSYSKEILIGKKCGSLLNLFSSDFIVFESNTRLVFENDEVVIIQRIDDNKYPDLLGLIPKSSPIEMQVDKKEFETTLKKALSCSSSMNHLVIFNINSRLTLSSEDAFEDRSYNRQMSCSHTGENLEIGFDAKKMLRILSTVKEPELSFKMSNSDRLCLINGSALQMPVKINKLT